MSKGGTSATAVGGTEKFRGGNNDTTFTSATATATNNTLTLDEILESPNFSVAWYLNTALANVGVVTDDNNNNNSSSTTNNNNNKNNNTYNYDDRHQQKMAELALQLQLQTQSCHEEIGKIGIEVQAIVPRCAADVNRISIGLNGLKMDAEQLLYDATSTSTTSPSTTAINPSKEESKSAEEVNGSITELTTAGGGVLPATSTSTTTTTSNPDDNNNNSNNQSTTTTTTPHHYSSLETLSTLHALQANLTRTKEILMAAATWDTTVSAIAPLLSNITGTNTNTTNTNTNTTNPIVGLNHAVQYLVQLENGEKALRGMPNPHERQQSIMKIRTQIISLLQPQLKQSLQTMNSTNYKVSTLQQCVYLYKQLNQLYIFKNEYTKHRPVVCGIHKLWFDYIPLTATIATTTPTTTTTTTTFKEWIPNWFDVVLSTITEERRHSSSIFGYQNVTNTTSTTSSGGNTTTTGSMNHSKNLEVVPEIIIRVFTECFRPILPSFKSRLEGICSSAPMMTMMTTTSGSSSSTSTGSLSDISNIYESMLQFLSLVYESITGGWLDMVESGSIQVVTQITAEQQHQQQNQNQDPDQVVINNGPTLYKELTKAFIQVAAPFAPYQKNLAQLETKYLHSQVQELAVQVQQEIESVVSTKNSGSTGSSTAVEGGWEALQSGTMDRLVSLAADTIIPICEGAVARFELLNGGYNVMSVLTVIDQTLAGHASELALAIQKLSYLTSINVNDKSGSIVSFDEAQIFCALQILKVAGMYRRNMKSLQSRTRERLHVLCERMIVHMKNEQQLEEAIQKLYSTGGKVAFQLPDSISVVEIDSLLTKSYLFDSVNDGTAPDAPLAVLQKLVNNADVDSIGSTVLFPQAQDSSKRLTTSCQTFVFDVCFAVPRSQLSGMSSLPAWKEQKSIVESWGGGGSSSYGTLPQPYITHIGEHMLALVQALEPFASDREALDISNEVMDIDSVRSVAYQFWVDFIAAATGSTGTESLARTLMQGTDLLDLTIGAIPIEEEEEEDNDPNGEQNEDEHARASTAFCNKWLDVVAFAVTGRLLERIMRIPSLTPKGCDHLNVDLGYLVNVLSALGISGHPHPLLGHVAEICILEQNVVAERITNLDRTNPSSDFLRALEERLSAMRGLK